MTRKKPIWVVKKFCAKAPERRYEIAVVRPDYMDGHGLKSWGWAGHGKIIIECRDLPQSVFKKVVSCAEKLAKELNK